MNEIIGWSMMVLCLIILAGTAIVCFEWFPYSPPTERRVTGTSTTIMVRTHDEINKALTWLPTGDYVFWINPWMGDQYIDD